MNVTLMSVRVTTASLKQQQTLHILSVFVALVILHAMRMRHILICGLSDSTLFLHIIS